MSKQQPHELGWYRKEAYFGNETKLAAYAISEDRGMIHQGYAKDGFVTTTLYPNDMYYVTFWKHRPAKKYFSALNASVFETVDGSLTELYSFHKEAHNG